MVRIRGWIFNGLVVGLNLCALRPNDASKSAVLLCTRDGTLIVADIVAVLIAAAAVDVGDAGGVPC